jgi:hypothetical protein
MGHHSSPDHTSTWALDIHSRKNLTVLSRSASLLALITLGSSRMTRPRSPDARETTSQARATAIGQAAPEIETIDSDRDRGRGRGDDLK